MKEINKTLAKLEQKMENMVGFRGTLTEITKEIQKFALRDGVFLEPFEENLKGMDLGFNTNLGEIDDTYFDFEVFMLPTRKEKVFIITEIASF